MHLMKYFIEVVGWLRIAASPTVGGALIGFLVYLAIPGTVGLILGIVITLLGIVTGGIWATRIWRKRGTISFLANENQFGEE
jgi:hypothetical protein